MAAHDEPEFDELVIDDDPAEADEPDQTDETDEPEAAPQKRRQWTGTRLVALIAGVAVVSLLAGVAVMQFIVSPAELAARTAPPPAGPVTAAVEQRLIENTVVARGEVTYADAVDVTIDTAGLTERAVVTGQVPEAGRVFNAGDVALEIAGRPVIVLPGDLPVYRSMSIGQRGPDVAQLKAALSALGFGAGDLGSDVFEGATAWAIAALYERVGYSAPVGQGSAQSVRDAEGMVRNAQLGVTQAQVALAQAQEAGSTDLRSEYASIEAANGALWDAQQALGTAQEAALPMLPASEVLFLGGLPRRVDEVRVKRGDILTGTAMTVSGASLTIQGTIAQQDAELLTEGLTATFTGPGGEDLTATVSRIDAPKAAGGSGGSSGQGSASGDGGSERTGGRYTVFLTPADLTPEQVEVLRGTNVRVRIPVASTDGEVLAVPIAALSAGSGGESRVEVLLGGKPGKEETETISVTTGLAADGFVEISSDSPRIKVGAKVVVGR